MAEDFAIGKELEIPKSVLDNIDKIDKKINDISKDSELMAQHFGSAMIRMGNGADVLLKKLQGIDAIISKMGNIDIGGISRISNNMGETAIESERVASNMSKISSAINRFGESNMNIAQLTENIKNLKKQLTEGEGVSKENGGQQFLVNRLRAYEEELKRQKKSQEDILNDREKAYKKELSIIDQEIASIKNIDKERKKAADAENERYVRGIQAEEKYNQAKLASLQKEVELLDKADKARSKSSQSNEADIADWVVRKKKEQIEAETQAAKLSAQFQKQEQERLEQIARNEDEKRKAKRASYEEALKYAEQLDKKEEAAAKKRIAEQKKATAEKEKEYEAQAKLDSRLRKSNYLSYVTSTEGSLRTADRANTYAQRAKAISNLEEAIKKLRTTDKNYEADLKRLSEAHIRLSQEQKNVENNFRTISKSQHKLMNTSDQLMRKLALIFSVSQIQGYLLQIRDVTGEFEKQNTALASILQNKDKADKLFGQITELAVKSPFTLKELITYTKSLSAYQVQYEKLYDTTKMLADVSAGLGVDMQRLILAFGQVKAANFLRGTEVRQFTEAGFNVLGELAKYYSELEGRMVSVGEVQERVTKRMVAFGDVEEIFKRVTSAGGIFYNMQEKQSETIAGLVSNLRDSIDLMLNDIGSANSGAIKQLILYVRSLYENWREVAWYIEKAVIALGTWKTVSMLAALGNSNLVKSILNVKDLAPEAAKGLTLMQKSMIGLKAASRGLLAGGALLLITWLFDLIRQSTEASRKAEQLSEALGKIQTESSIRASELSSNFKKLADEAVNAADGSEEQNRALKELNLTYAELVPAEMLKIKNLREMKGEYDSVTSAIYSKIEAETREKMAQQVSNVYGSDAVNAADKLAQKLTEYGISLSKAKTIVAEFRKEFDKGLISSPQTAQRVLEKLIKSFTGLSVSLTEKGFKQTSGGKTWGDVIISELDDTYNALVKFSVEYEKVKDTTLEVFREGGGTELYSQLKSELEKVSKYQEDWNKKNKGNFEFSIEFSEESKKQQIAQYQKFIDDINKKISSGEIKQTDIVSANLIIEDAQKAIDKLNVSDSVQKIEQLRLEFSKLYNIDFGKLNFTQMLETQGFSEYVKVLDENIANYEKKISVFEEAAKRGQQVPLMQAESLLNGKTLEQINKEYIALQDFRDSINKDFDKKDKSSSNTALQRLKDQIALIKKAGEEYKKLRKYYSEGDATKQVRESFADAFSNLGLDISMTFDTSGIIDGIKNIQHQTIQGGKKAVDEALAPLKSEQNIKVKADGIEEIQKQIDDIFSNYEFNLELQSAGIDAGAFKNMLQDLGATDEEISMVGLDVTTFEEVAEKVRKAISDLQKQGGDDQIKQARKIQEQLTALEVKEARKRFDELAKLREKYQTNQEKMQTVQTNLFADKDALALLEEQKAMGKAVNKEQEELLKLRIQSGEDALLQLKSEALQLTDFWQRLFGDLNDISVNSLLELSRITDEIIDNRTEIKGDSGEIKGYSSSYTDKDGITKQVTLTKQQYQQLLKQNNQVADEIQKKNPFRALYEAILKGKQEGETQLDYYTRLESIINGVSDAAFGAAENLMDIFGANDEAKEMLNNIKGIADGAVSLGMGVAKIASGNPLEMVGGSIQAIQGVAGIVSAINSIHDNKREKEIQRQMDLIEELQRSYEKLQEAIEGAYSINTYKASYEQSVANLEAQNEALRNAIAAEQDKKKTDDDRIKEWQNQIQDNLDAIKELEEKFIADLGGFGSDANVKSAAQEFADAWLEAYMETGDGLDALSDKWDEYIQNVVAKQLMLKGTEKYLKPVMDMLDGMLQDSVFTPKEAEEIQNKIDQVIPQLNEFWKAIAGSFDLGAADEGDTMSGLSKSISGITEETADALAAITESIRYFSADSNAVLKQIYNAIALPNVENPFLMELKQQTSLLTSINSLFSSVIKTSAGKGKVLRMEIA